MSTLRLARFLARAGASSRRGAADLVAAGRVRINGKPPVGPGDPVDPAADRVTLDGRLLQLSEGAWLVLNKPPGVETSRKSSERHPSVFGLLKGASAALVAVGRLDVLSEGLLFFTTDGDLAARLMHPSWEVPRTYRVDVSSVPDAAAKHALDRGVKLPDEPRKVMVRHWRFKPSASGGYLDIELAEGRSRVVRRICAELGLGIRSLKRVAYGPLALGSLARGRSRSLTDEERAALYAAVELDPPL